ncbi:MAG: hypothetical protein DMD72_09685 [Gemmatimonadetes bacterium]|nr:MAG: hypothetical protein DMD72_09685 [Gemmatimonadota bacterium]
MRKRLLISAIIGVGFLCPTITRAQSAADSAAIRATALDYMHMARYNGQWRILNVLWENEPPKR